MPEFIFVPEESLAAIDVIEAADAAQALAAADLGPLPQKTMAVQVIGTYWVMDDKDAQVVYKPHVEPGTPAPAVQMLSRPEE